MTRKLIAGLLVLLQLLMIDSANLAEFGPVLGVLHGVWGQIPVDGGCGRGGGAGGRDRAAQCAAGFLRSGDTFRHQHVVQPHQLLIRRLLVDAVAQGEGRLVLEVAEHTEERLLHVMVVQGVFPCLGFIQ